MRLVAIDHPAAGVVDVRSRLVTRKSHLRLERLVRVTKYKRTVRGQVLIALDHDLLQQRPLDVSLETTLRIIGEVVVRLRSLCVLCREEHEIENPLQ